MTHLLKKTYWIDGIGELLLLVFAGWWLIGKNGDFLYMIQELSLFQPTRWGFMQALQQPAGIVLYGSQFLTQFFYYPWLGAGIFLILGVLFQGLLIRSCRLPAFAWSLTFLPLAALIAGGTSLGYMIYHTSRPEVLFSQLLGMLGSIGLFYGFSVIRSCKIPCFLVVVLVGYPLLGAWGLIAGGLCLLAGIKGKITYTSACWQGIGGIGSMVAVPWLYRIVYTHTPVSELYTVGLPPLWLQGHVVVSYTVWILLGGILMLLVAFGDKWKTEKYPFGLTGAALLLSVTIIVGMSYKDKNFRTEIAMYRVMDRRNWNEMPELYRQSAMEPSRFMVLARNLGFYRLGLAGQRTFTMPDGTRQADAPFQVGLEQIGGEWFYYHYGLINYAYRWGMEKMVKWGMRARELKLMAKCALLKGENALAVKYLKTLENTLFHRPWAKYYLAFATGGRQLTDDLEFRAILPLYRATNLLDNDRRNVELYLLDQLSFLDNGTPEGVEVSLLANMMEKNKLKTFMRFSAYAATHADLPVHYQEAALLFAFLTHKDIDGIERFDMQVLRRFRAFMDLWKRQGERVQLEDELLFRKDFAATYWYYYLFGPELRRGTAGIQDKITSPH